MIIYIYNLTKHKFFKIQSWFVMDFKPCHIGKIMGTPNATSTPKKWGAFFPGDS